MSMQKIVPHLWFDTQAKEAAEFYVSVFPESHITNVTTLHGTPSGDCDIVSFDVWGYSFLAMSAGPLFKVNPSISFMVNFDPSRDPDAKAKLDAIWDRLIDGGSALMELGAYPFSEHYGWVQDKFGVSWQLILTKPEGKPRPPIMPSMLFVGDVYGKAEAASDFYLSVFASSQRGRMVRYGAGHAPDKEEALMFTDFQLENQWFIAMDSAYQHAFAFNEAVSFIVHCDDQTEVDFLWEKLSAVPEAEQCGWLKDAYGVSWQIVPKQMTELMRRGTPEQISRVTQALLQMKKLDIATLQGAYKA